MDVVVTISHLFLHSNIFFFQQEVGVFPTEWFTPCILVYAQKGFADNFDTKSMSLLILTYSSLHLSLSLSLHPPLPPIVMSQLDRSVLLTETKGIRPVQSPATFTPLSLAETPQPGDLAAIDAEFVTLNQVKIDSMKYNKIIKTALCLDVNSESCHCLTHVEWSLTCMCVVAPP